MGRKIIYQIILIPYITLCSVLLIIYILLHFDPSGYALGGISVLFFPFVIVISIIAVLLMLLVKWKIALPGILILLMNFSNMRMIFAVHFANSFQQQKNTGELRMMTWNVRAFMPSNEQIYDVKKTSIEDIVSNLNEWEPDIICLQEFFTYTRNHRRNLEIITKQGYPYHAFADQVLDGGELRTGTILFSKFPIVRSQTISMPEKFADRDEEPMIADIK
ncbi:MAG: endonuclease/exonuclease/phosphatase family protein, partial [Chitinophagaceae bacterium]